MSKTTSACEYNYILYGTCWKRAPKTTKDMNEHSQKICMQTCKQWNEKKKEKKTNLLVYWL